MRRSVRPELLRSARLSQAEGEPTVAVRNDESLIALNCFCDLLRYAARSNASVSAGLQVSSDLQSLGFPCNTRFARRLGRAGPACLD